MRVRTLYVVGTGSDSETVTVVSGLYRKYSSTADNAAALYMQGENVLAVAVKGTPPGPKAKAVSNSTGKNFKNYAEGWVPIHREADRPGSAGTGMYLVNHGLFPQDPFGEGSKIVRTLSDWITAAAPIVYVHLVQCFAADDGGALSDTPTEEEKTFVHTILEAFADLKQRPILSAWSTIVSASALGKKTTRSGFEESWQNVNDEQRAASKFGFRLKEDGKQIVKIPADQIRQTYMSL